MVSAVLMQLGMGNGSGRLVGSVLKILALVVILAATDETSETTMLDEASLDQPLFATRVLKESIGNTNRVVAGAVSRTPPSLLKTKHDPILSLQGPEVMQKVSAAVSEIRSRADATISQTEARARQVELEAFKDKRAAIAKGQKEVAGIEQATKQKLDEQATQYTVLKEQLAEQEKTNKDEIETQQTENREKVLAARDAKRTETDAELQIQVSQALTQALDDFEAKQVSEAERTEVKKENIYTYADNKVASSLAKTEGIRTRIAEAEAAYEAHENESAEKAAAAKDAADEKQEKSDDLARRSREKAAESSLKKQEAEANAEKAKANAKMMLEAALKAAEDQKSRSPKR